MITATKMASAARGKAGQTHHVNRGARPKARGAVTTSARASGAMRQHNQPQPQPIQQKIFTGTDGDTHEKKTREEDTSVDARVPIELSILPLQ